MSNQLGPDHPGPDDQRPAHTSEAAATGWSAQHSPDFASLVLDPDFLTLRRRFRAFVFPMTAAFLAWYLLYVVLSAWARDFMGHKVIGVVNVAFVFGLLQFVSTFAIAAIYSRFAARTLDPLADRVVSTNDLPQVTR